MDTKTVYNCAPMAPHIYIGPQQCYKTSLDSDTWHWTGLALEVEPPATADHEIAIANLELTAWNVVADYVGHKYWLADGSEHVITEYGVLPPQDALPEMPEPEPLPKTKYSPLEFLEKFTETEQLAVVSASMTEVAVKLWWDKLLAAGFVDLEDPRTTGGVNALVDAGLLDQARVAEILQPD